MRTSSPEPPGQTDAAPWRRWLLPAALAAGLVTLLALPRGAAPGMALSYTKFLADVGAGTVRAVTISPAGQVTGSLAGGHPFTTTIPVALGGNGLAGDLAAHHVQVTATTATPTSLLSVLIGLLPLLLFGALLYIGIRRVPLPSGGGLGGLGGLGKAKARVIDAERPATRFTDVAGYTTVKTEISEVVDYLRDPGRWHRAGARGPRGVLMAGPPGTGKTLLARAEHTQWLVDQEVAALLTKAETRARDLLTSHREALAQLTAALLEQETVTGDQVRALAWAAMTTASEPSSSTNRISR